MTRVKISAWLVRWAAPTVLLFGLGLSALVAGNLASIPNPLAATGAVFATLAATTIVMTALVYVLTRAAAAAARLAQSATTEAKANEQRFRDLFRLTPDPLLVSRRTVILMANDAAARLFLAGSPEELVGRSLRELVAPDAWALTESRIALLEAGSEQLLPPVERGYVALDGTSLAVESSGARIVMNGEPAVLSVKRDVSERRRTEMQLRLAATVFETSREGVTITDAGRNIISINPAFSAITGYEPQEVLGRNPRLLQSGRHDAAFYEAIWASINGQGRWMGEIWNRRKNGEIYPEWLSITAVRDARGAPLHYIGIFTDITGIKRAEQALRENEAQLRKAQEVAGLGSWTIDLPNGAVTWSDVTCRIFGVPPGSPVEYATFLERVHPEDRDRLHAAWNAALEGAPYDIEHRILVDGSEKWVRERAELGFDSLGRACHGIGTVQDITTRKRAELQVRQLNESLEQRVRSRTAELLASNKELEAFSYSVSHDLRAPLRSIDGFAQIIIEEYAHCLDREGLGYLSRIRQASQHMAELIDDMLELARITRATLHRREVDLSALVGAIAEELRDGSGRNAEFVIADHLTAEADPALIGVVLENLLRNAWKFTGRTAGARIEFGAMPLEGERAFFVRDNGAGFDAAYAGKLFRAFQRLHHARDFPGTGIGLATVQRVIERHGGRVWAEGAVGQGATFYFTLP